MEAIDVDLGEGDVALIIRADGTVQALLPPDEMLQDQDGIAPYNIGLITACWYLLTANRAETLAMIEQLSNMVNLEGADA